MTLATVIKGNKIQVLTNSIQNEQEKHLVCGWEENNNSVPTDIVKQRASKCVFCGEACSVSVDTASPNRMV